MFLRLNESGILDKHFSHKTGNDSAYLYIIKNIPFRLVNSLLKALFSLHLSAPGVCNLQKAFTAQGKRALECYKLLITLFLISIQTWGGGTHTVGGRLSLTLWRDAKEVNGRKKGQDCKSKVDNHLRWFKISMGHHSETSKMNDSCYQREPG